ncbi:hypothetical protein RABR111495_25190 [Rahnella bruchi]
MNSGTVQFRSQVRCTAMIADFSRLVRNTIVCSPFRNNNAWCPGNNRAVSKQGKGHRSVVRLYLSHIEGLKHRAISWHSQQSRRAIIFRDNRRRCRRFINVNMQRVIMATERKAFRQLVTFTIFNKVITCLNCRNSNNVFGRSNRFQIEDLG